MNFVKNIKKIVKYNIKCDNSTLDNYNYKRFLYYWLQTYLAIFVKRDRKVDSSKYNCVLFSKLNKQILVYVRLYVSYLIYCTHRYFSIQSWLLIVDTQHYCTSISLILYVPTKLKLFYFRFININIFFYLIQIFFEIFSNISHYYRSNDKNMTTVLIIFKIYLLNTLWYLYYSLIHNCHKSWLLIIVIYLY